MGGSMARRENVKAVARAWMRALIEAGSTRDQAGAELVALARSLAADGQAEAASVVAEVSRQPEHGEAAPPPEPGDEAILLKLSELEAARTPAR